MLAFQMPRNISVSDGPTQGKKKKPLQQAKGILLKLYETTLYPQSRFFYFLEIKKTENPQMLPLL